MKKLLKACGVKQSVSNTGNPYDNAVIESFFATFKKELINLKSYDTVAQLKIDVDEYMDYYNHYRPHRTLGNKTPSQFEDEYHERLNVTVNVLQVLKTRTIERPSYFSKFQGIKASISSSVEFGFILFKSISVNSPGLYPFALAVC